jgi:hypothetical protein
VSLEGSELLLGYGYTSFFHSHFCPHKIYTYCVNQLCLLMEYGLNAACKQGDQLASEKGSRLL